jgi:glutamate/tyrosine decarboxylase-like PLP-dependent enzyme
MSFRPEDFDAPLDRARALARSWLVAEIDRPVRPEDDIDAVLARLPSELQHGPADPTAVVDELAAAVEPGLMSMGSGRFFGWVIGGTLPSALAADWLVSAWDQNSALRFATPGVVAVEEVAAGWILDLLGLPAEAEVGFVTGAQMANFTGLAAGRQHVLTQAGWDLDRLGLSGAPRVTVLASEDRHATVDLALRYLGLGAPTLVAVDDQGRIRSDALASALAGSPGPTIVCLAAGNLHSGAFDPFSECIPLAHAAGAWVHVDGAFGLWAAASPSLQHLMAGCADADSWATDAHKTLNTPYDCGIAIVRNSEALRSALGTSTSYLIADGRHSDPFETVPEFSRRARGVPVWAALRALGRTGVTELLDNLVLRARQIAEGVATIPGARVVNDVDYTQVCVAFEDDERTRAVTARLLADGVAWMSGSRWRGIDVLRVSVSNWSTDDRDVELSLDALRRAAA